jgi:hypothetical protein
VPNGAHPTLIASLGHSLTGEVPLDFSVGVPVLYVSRADSGAVRSQAQLNGRVETADGRPLGNAAIGVEGSGAMTTSAADGTFHLAGGPAGTQIVSVRRLGFVEWAAPVTLSTARPDTVRVVLAPQVAKLPTVNIKATPELLAAAYTRIGFTAREQGPDGRFLNADAIAHINAANLAGLLQHVPGVRVLPDGNTGLLRIASSHVGPVGPTMPTKGRPLDFGNGSRICTTFVVDGQPMPPDFIDDQSLPQPRSLIAVEVYQPEESYSGNQSRTNCLTILIWTKAQLASP